MPSQNLIFDRPRLVTASLTSAAALAIFAVGSRIPVPGVDARAYETAAPYIGGAMARLSIFALGVTPIFSAMLLVETARAAIAPFDRYAQIDKGAERCRSIILWLALAIAALQGQGVALGYEGIDGLVTSPGAAFHATVVATFVASTAFLSWLSSQIDSRGVGDGFWLLYLAPVFAAAPGHVSALTTLARTGELSHAAIGGAVGFVFVAMCALVVAGLAKDRALGLRRASMAEIWPPIIGAYASLLIVSFGAFALGADPSAWSGGAVHFALIAFLTLLVTSLRNPVAPRAVWLLALAQILTCVGGVYLTRRLSLPVAIDGASLIIMASLSRSLFARWFQADGV